MDEETLTALTNTCDPFKAEENNTPMELPIESKVLAKYIDAFSKIPTDLKST